MFCSTYMRARTAQMHVYVETNEYIDRQYLGQQPSPTNKNRAEEKENDEGIGHIIK